MSQIKCLKPPLVEKSFSILLVPPVVLMKSAKNSKVLTFYCKDSKRDTSVTERQILHKNMSSRSILKHCEQASNIVPDAADETSNKSLEHHFKCFKLHK